MGEDSFILNLLTFWKYNINCLYKFSVRIVNNSLELDR